ncbi:MAG: hypothetical protein GXO85_03180 [Chlorobi bacterium]|nr:hypothetical protein [Chlorobiota bacterium]
MISGFTATYSFLNGDSIVTEQGKYTLTDSKGWSLGMFYVFPIKKEESRNIFNVFMEPVQQKTTEV